MMFPPHLLGQELEQLSRKMATTVGMDYRWDPIEGDPVCQVFRRLERVTHLKFSFNVTATQQRKKDETVFSLLTISRVFSHPLSPY